MSQLTLHWTQRPTGVKGKQGPTLQTTPGILWPSANDAKTYLGILWYGHG